MTDKGEVACWAAIDEQAGGVLGDLRHPPGLQSVVAAVDHGLVEQAEGVFVGHGATWTAMGAPRRSSRAMVASPWVGSPLQAGNRNSKGVPSGPDMKPAMTVSSSGAAATTWR